MPVYNAGEYFKSALNSIRKQDYPNWELLIADDGCTDGCLEVLKTINDPRIKVISDGFNLGISKRLNQLIDVAKGEYIARMDGDDISHQKRISEQVKFLANNPDCDLVATRANTIDIKNQVIGELPYKLTHREICEKPWLGFYMAHPTWMGKAQWFKKFKYSEKTYFCEDQELLLRSHETSRFETLNQTLLDYRVYSNINLIKHFKTRVSMFVFQTQYFFSKNAFANLLMSFFALIFKLIKSIIKKISG